LWEMACARNIGLSQLPIVCVNTNGYYEPFKEMLQRAWEDQLTKLEPHQIVHFSETAQEAVQWVEEVVAATAAGVTGAAGSAEATRLPTLQKRNAALRKASVLGRPVTERNSSDDFSLLQSIRKSFSNMSDLVFLGDNDHENDSRHGDTTRMMRRRVSVAAIASSLVFCAGVAVGFLLSEQRQQQQREPSLGRFS
jgi:Possible lysine decarboxylase